MTDTLIDGLTREELEEEKQFYIDSGAAVAEIDEGRGSVRLCWSVTTTRRRHNSRLLRWSETWSRRIRMVTSFHPTASDRAARSTPQDGRQVPSLPRQAAAAGCERLLCRAPGTGRQFPNRR